MTTATKLSLGFGALIVLLVVSNAAVLLPLQSVDSEIQAMTEVGRPRRVAAKSMEVGVLSYALAVRTFAQNGDPAYQKEAENAIVEIESQHQEYTRLAETERQRNSPSSSFRGGSPSRNRAARSRTAALAFMVKTNGEQ